MPPALPAPELQQSPGPAGRAGMGLPGVIPPRGRARCHRATCWTQPLRSDPLRPSLAPQPNLGIPTLAQGPGGCAASLVAAPSPPVAAAPRAWLVPVVTPEPLRTCAGLSTLGTPPAVGLGTPQPRAERCFGVPAARATRFSGRPCVMAQGDVQGWPSPLLLQQRGALRCPPGAATPPPHPSNCPPQICTRRQGDAPLFISAA